MKRIIFNENVSVTFIVVSFIRNMVIFDEKGRVPGGIWLLLENNQGNGISAFENLKLNIFQLFLAAGNKKATHPHIIM